MKAPKVSIIIPMYNAELSIKRCAISLFEQSLDDLEFIFIDDYSTDKGKKVLEELLQLYPNRKPGVKIISHSKNKGSAAARNTGLGYAKGEYIGWVDADDWVEPKMFDDLYTTALTNMADIVWNDYYVDYQEYKVRVSQRNSEESLDCIGSLISGQLIGTLWNKLIKKELLIANNIKFVEGQNMAEDLRVSVQLFHYAKKLIYLPNAYYYYDKSGAGTISFQNTRKADVNKEWVTNVEGILRFLEKKGLTKTLDKEIGLLKLSPKKNLLVKGTTEETYKKWRTIFPESNSFVWKTKLPLHYKILAWCADKEIWPVIRLWIFIKYKVFKPVLNQ